MIQRKFKEYGGGAESLPEYLSLPGFDGDRAPFASIFAFEFGYLVDLDNSANVRDKPCFLISMRPEDEGITNPRVEYELAVLRLLTVPAKDCDINSMFKHVTSHVNGMRAWKGHSWYQTCAKAGINSDYVMFIIYVLLTDMAGLRITHLMTRQWEEMNMDAPFHVMSQSHPLEYHHAQTPRMDVRHCLTYVGLSEEDCRMAQYMLCSLLMQHMTIDLGEVARYAITIAESIHAFTQPTSTEILAFIGSVEQRHKVYDKAICSPRRPNGPMQTKYSPDVYIAKRTLTERQTAAFPDQRTCITAEKYAECAGQYGGTGGIHDPTQYTICVHDNSHSHDKGFIVWFPDSHSRMVRMPARMRDNPLYRNIFYNTPLRESMALTTPEVTILNSLTCMLKIVLTSVSAQVWKFSVLPVPYFTTDHGVSIVRHACVVIQRILRTGNPGLGPWVLSQGTRDYGKCEAWAWFASQYAMHPCSRGRFGMSIQNCQICAELETIKLAESMAPYMVWKMSRPFWDHRYGGDDRVSHTQLTVLNSTIMLEQSAVGVPCIEGVTISNLREYV